MQPESINVFIELPECRSSDRARLADTATGHAARPRRPWAGGIHLAMIIVGLIPWIGLAIVGEWSQAELALSAMLFIGGVWAMIDERWGRGARSGVWRA